MADQKETKQLPFQLAQASWIAPLLMLAVNYFLRQGGTDGGASRAVIVTLLGGFLYLTGLGCGVAALFWIPKHGWRGILIPAAIGILISGGFLVIMAIIFLQSLAAHG